MLGSVESCRKSSDRPKSAFHSRKKFPTPLKPHTNWTFSLESIFFSFKSQSILHRSDERVLKARLCFLADLNQHKQSGKPASFSANIRWNTRTLSDLHRPIKAHENSKDCGTSMCSEVRFTSRCIATMGRKLHLDPVNSRPRNVVVNCLLRWSSELCVKCRLQVVCRSVIFNTYGYCMVKYRNYRFGRLHSL